MKKSRLVPRRLGSRRRFRSDTLVAYFAPNDVLVPRVDRQCIMRFCGALSNKQADVEVVSLDVRIEFDEPTRARSLWDVYGLLPTFVVTILPCSARQSGERTAPLALWRTFAYSLYAFWLGVKEQNRRRRVVFYFKNYLFGLSFVALRALFPRRIVLLFEIHVPPSGRLDRWLLSRFDGLIPVSRILARELQADFRIPPERILVAHQGVDVRFVEERRIGKSEARHALGLPADRRLVIYTGKVHAAYREIDLLTEAAGYLDDTADMIIVGGRPDQVEILRQREQGRTNVRFVGFVAPADVFAYQMAADVLVAYYPSDIPINRYRASPGKVFEYMASQRPIVAVDLPALREILEPDAAVFVEPDDPRRLAEAIRGILNDERLGVSLAESAFRDVQEFTWDKRAERVLEFIQVIAPSNGSAAPR